MAIAVIENAAGQIRTRRAKRGKRAGLRGGVKKVGCSGFAYAFGHADENHPGGRLFQAHNAKLRFVKLQ